MKKPSFIALSIVLTATSVTAQSDSQDGLVSQLREALTRLEAYEKRISDLEAASLSIPTGAVIAFDRPNGCPDGWTSFEAGAGRMVVGAGGKYELPYIEGIPRYQTGGEESHKLTVEEMPSHAHKLVAGQGAGTGEQYFAWNFVGELPAYEYGSSRSVGEGHAHNNMPPYIVLYYCKKEG